MNEIYKQRVMLKREEISELLALFQQAASNHQSALGMGREEMFCRGLLWMITRQKLRVNRIPISGEDVTLSTWLSEERHGMYLRQYELTDADGAVLCQAAAVWGLVGAESRKLSPLRLKMPIHQEKHQLPRFPLLRPVETEQKYSFTVTAEYLDENGHMNNARYFNVVAPILPKNLALRAAQVDYHMEAREGDSLAIGYVMEENRLLIQARGDRGLCFRMKLDYE